jgi:hypothetical protein
MIMPLDWNMEYFSLSGYASILTWAGGLVLLLVHFIFKTRQVICHSALAISLVAFALAKFNSLTYVNKIQPDLSQQKAELEAKIAAKQQEVLDDRRTQVAQIQFAEDGKDEFLDRAGLDEEDLETIDQIREELTPEWKQEKKTRSSPTADSAGEGMDTSLVENSIEDEPVTMLEIDMMRANQYDYLNLIIIKILIGLSMLVIIYDYLRRHNLYEVAYFPIKIPSALANLITPYPPVIDRSRQPRRSVAEELAWLTKRGDSFVYFSSNPENIKQAEEILVPFSEKKKDSLQVIKTVNAECSDDFVFENWWFGRASIIVDNANRAESMVQKFIQLLGGRKSTRAKIRQTAHLVWDLDFPIPTDTQVRLEQLAARTGFSLLICKSYE